MTARPAGHTQRMRALFPPPHRATPRGMALDYCLHLRSLRSWIQPGAYAWWRLTDDIRQAQRALLDIRRATHV